MHTAEQPKWTVTVNSDRNSFVRQTSYVDYHNAYEVALSGSRRWGFASVFNPKGVRISSFFKGQVLP